MELDKVDSQIIEILGKNSRISLRKIAKETGLTLDTVARRYRKLEEKKVIQPCIVVDLVKLGYEALVYFGILVTSQNVRRAITKKVAEIPDIVAVMETTGEYDLTVIAVVRNIRHTFKIGEDISRVIGVRRVSISQFEPAISNGGIVYPPPVWHNLDIAP